MTLPTILRSDNDFRKAMNLPLVPQELAHAA